MPQKKFEFDIYHVLETQTQSALLDLRLWVNYVKEKRL